MIDLKQIVVATDFSPYSQHAVSYACELAEQFNAQIHLLHIVCYPFLDFADQSQLDYGRTIAECEKQHLQAAEEGLAKINVAPLTDADRVIRVAQAGFPVPDIPRYAEDTDSDLLVLGTHGHTGVKHVLMGSVCEAVVRRAQCPVLTIRGF